MIFYRRFIDDTICCSVKTIHVSHDPARAGVARYARNGACLVCDTDNMNSNATNKTHTGPKRVRIQEPEEEQET